MGSTALLVVAKSPEPGTAKTRLSPPATSQQAAAIAAAGLLDTLCAVRETADSTAVVAWAGQLSRGIRQEEVAAALTWTGVIEQRGDSLGARLSAAHAETADRLPGCPVLQIGMDTPQVSGELLAESAAVLHRSGGPDAVLGPATDGGWWALGLRDPRCAKVLEEVPMSRQDTGETTLRALRSSGLDVELLPELSDVDTMDDAVGVAAAVPGSRFAAAVHSVIESDA